MGLPHYIIKGKWWLSWISKLFTISILSAHFLFFADWFVFFFVLWLCLTSPKPYRSMIWMIQPIMFIDVQWWQWWYNGYIISIYILYCRIFKILCMILFYSICYILYVYIKLCIMCYIYMYIFNNLIYI